MDRTHTRKLNAAFTDREFAVLLALSRRLGVPMRVVIRDAVIAYEASLVDK